VSHGDDAGHVESGVELGEVVDACCDVEERIGPAAAPADAPVLPTGMSGGQAWRLMRIAPLPI